jgi:hypothetical protein
MDRRSSWQTLSSWIGDRKFGTDSLCEEVGDFSVTGDGISVARLRILPKCALAALPPQYATMPAGMPEQPLALHPTTTNSCLASGGRARKDSSRLCSRIKAIASRRFARHSSRVLPCPLAPGTSAQYPTYQGPSCSTIAVNSLRISLFYRRGVGTGSGKCGCPERRYSPTRRPRNKPRAGAAAETIAVAIFALVFSRANRFARALPPFELSASALPAFGMA